MPIFQIGVDINVAKYTTILIRLEAENELVAKELAVKELHRLSHSHNASSRLLKRVDPNHWDEGSYFEIEGPSRDDYPIEHYEADIDLTKEESNVDK